ncbi:MAG: SAM-dependent methyltransferase [Hyphomonadaceae bacterium]|nr:SAM-dependent methyltransferase [Hyphomonadaceae bacterium]
MKAEVAAIATVRSPRKDLADDFWGAVEADIVLDEAFDETAFFGLDDFTHVEVLFLMHRVDAAKIEKGARHPREREDWPLVGIFAQRGKARPNRIGLTRAMIVKVVGRVLTVRGLDAIDGTPVLDVKPWMDEFAPIGVTRQPEWATELMRDYFKD